MPQVGILRKGHIEIVSDELFRQRFGELLVDGRVPYLARERRRGAIARHHRERRHGLQEEGLHVVADEDHQDIGLGLIEGLA